MGRDSGRVQRGITNRHEGLGVHAGLGDPNGVDGKDSHLIEDALDHVGGLVGGLREDLEVQLHPALGALLLPLQEVSWKPPTAERSVGSHGEAWGHRSVRGSQGHSRKSHDPERYEAMNIRVIEQVEVTHVGPGIKKGHRP